MVTGAAPVMCDVRRVRAVMKKLAIILVGASLLVGGAVALAFSHYYRHGKPIESLYRYELPDEPTSLTEELAMIYAQKALMQDGLSTNRWHPDHDRRTDAWGTPAGSFAVRNKNNSNHVCIAFRCDQMPTRTISVYLFGKAVVCCSAVPE